MVIILLGVIDERLLAQLTPGPGEIERMLQEMFFRDVAIDGLKTAIHMETPSSHL
jgi:hypothetical protein